MEFKTDSGEDESELDQSSIDGDGSNTLRPVKESDDKAYNIRGSPYETHQGECLHLA